MVDGQKYPYPYTGHGMYNIKSSTQLHNYSLSLDINLQLILEKELGKLQYII